MATKISASSTETREPKVVVKRQARVNGRTKNVNSLIPAHQAGRRAHRPCVYHQTFRSVPSTLLAGSSARYTGRIESGAFHRSNAGGVLRVQITLSQASSLTPTWTWFDRLSFRSSGGSAHVTTLYSDSLAFMLNEYADQELASILPLCNSSASWGVGAELPAGSHTFYLPLGKSFMEQLHFDDLSGDILVDFYPMSGGISSSGGANTVSTDTLSMLMLSDCVTQQDKAQTKALHAGNIISRVFLAPLRMEHNALALVAGQERQLFLDNVTGNVACFQVCIRAAGATNHNNAHFNYVSPGAARIDLKNAAGRSELGEGQPVDDDFLRSFVWPRSVGNNFAQQNACIIIPCCDSVKAALSGVRSGGYRTYKGDRDTISITPGPGFASGTYQVVVYAYVFKMLHKRGGELIVENA